MADILIVEDDSTIRSILAMTLKGAGYGRVRTASRGDEGMEAIRQSHPALVLLDLMLPGLDGLSICRLVRENPDFADTRILMLTAKGEDEDVVRGLELGADDYVVKPFSREVLLARINAVLRRQNPMDAGRRIDGLLLDERGSSVRLGDEVLSLTRLEFRILALLVGHPGRVFTRQQIIDATQGDERLVTERTVDVQLVGLRKKLGAWAAHVETIRGIGYRVKP